MLHFAEAGSRTSKPEDLSVWQTLLVLVAGVTIPKPANTATPDAFDLSYETHYLDGHNPVELEAWYVPHPQSQATVVMFHGYATAKSSMLAEAQALHELGYSTFLVDFRGSGGSNQSSTSVGYYEAEDVATSFAYVRTRLGQETVILYGQSMGGVAVLRAVANLDVKPSGIIIEAIFDTMTGTVANRFDAIGLPAFPATHALIFWASVIGGHWGFDHNPVDYAPLVDAPVLILHGAADTRATLTQAEAVYAQLDVDKRFEVFQDVGHESYVAVHPEQWKEAIGHLSRWLE